MKIRTRRSKSGSWVAQYKIEGAKNSAEWQIVSVYGEHDRYEPFDSEAEARKAATQKAKRAYLSLLNARKMALQATPWKEEEVQL